MSARDVLAQALKLKPTDRFAVIEGIIHSLDNPDSTLDLIWAEEAEKRLLAHRNGQDSGFLFEDIFSSR